jgi:hypothetical protein
VKRISAINAIIDDAEDDQESELIEFVDLGPAGDIPDDAPLYPAARDLCAVVNGMRCSGIDIYSMEDILERGLSYATRLPGGSEAWHAIGDVVGIPVLLKRDDGTIWYPTIWSGHTFDEGPLQQIAPDLWTFVGWFVMGPGYLDVFSNPDEWVAFLREHDLFDWEDPE